MTDQKVVLDGDDIRRTLVRIAHEIVEKNAEPERLAIVGIHRRGAVLARRLGACVSDLLEAEVPLGDLDISFYRDDLSRRRRRAGRPRLAPRLRRRRPHRRGRRRRPLHRAHRARRHRGALRLRPAGAGPARRAGRPRPPRAADPPRLRRQEPPDRARRARQRARRGARRRRRGDHHRARRRSRA